MIHMDKNTRVGKNNLLGKLTYFIRQFKGLIWQIVGLILATVLLVQVVKSCINKEIPKSNPPLISLAQHFLSSSNQLFIDERRRQISKPSESPYGYAIELLSTEMEYSLNDSVELNEAIEHFKSMRINLLKDGMQKLRNQFIFPVNEHFLQQSQSEAFDRGQLINVDNQVNHLLVIDNEEMEVIDSSFKKLKLKYSLKVATPIKVRTLVPNRILSSWDSLLRRSEEYEKLRGHLVGERVDFGKMIKELSGDEEFKTFMNKRLSDNKSLFNLVDLGLSAEDSEEYQVFFSKGQHRLSALNLYILSHVVDRFENIILNNLDKKVIITCYGFTDELKVIDSITYNGEAYYRQDENEILLRKPNGYLVKPYINNNRQLSFVRAYTGIKFIQKLFDKKLNKIRHPIEYAYVGKGIDFSRVAKNKTKRRIELRLTIK